LILGRDEESGDADQLQIVLLYGNRGQVAIDVMLGEEHRFALHVEIRRHVHQPVDEYCALGRRDLGLHARRIVRPLRTECGARFLSVSPSEVIVVECHSIVRTRKPRALFLKSDTDRRADRGTHKNPTTTIDRFYFSSRLGRHAAPIPTRRNSSILTGSDALARLRSMVSALVGTD